MTYKPVHRKQRGAVTIFISMILLLLITALVLTAYTMSTTNFRAVGNVQTRNEAIDAANYVIERRIQTNFWNLAGPVTSAVDLNLDTIGDYTVTLLKPQCVRVVKAAGAASSSVTLPGMSSNNYWHTFWEFNATSTEAATGTSVNIVQGFRVLLTAALKDKYCI